MRKESNGRKKGKELESEKRQKERKKKVSKKKNEEERRKIEKSFKVK